MQAVYFYNPPPFKYFDYTFLEQLKDSLEVNKKYFKKIMLLTTDKNLKLNFDIDEILFMDCKSLAEVHFNRVCSWYYFVNSKNFSDNTVFLDSDIIFNKNFEFLFDQDFLIGINAQKKTTSPLNAGVILVKNVKGVQITQHFKNMVNIAKEIKNHKDKRFPMIENSGIWGSDELVLNIYLSKYKKNLNQFIKNSDLEIISKISEDISLLSDSFSIAYKNVEKEIADYFSIHFAGKTKIEMKRYINYLIKLDKEN